MWLMRWARASQERALANAREASTELGRRRVEREEVELFLRQRYGGAPAADVRRAATGR